MIESIVSLFLFTLVASATPGPNNIMIMASGAAFGIARSVPHIAGIIIGFAAVIIASGFGVGALIARFPVLETVLMSLAVLFLLSVAWRMARASAPHAAGAPSRPMSFIEAALFQWINPKAWAMALSVVTLYVGSARLPGNDLVFVVATFAAVGVFCVTTWCVFGSLLARAVADTPGRWRLLNSAMAILMVLSVVPLLI